MQHPTLQLYREAPGEFMFRLSDREGRILFTSGESYTSKLFCFSAMEFIKAHSPFDNFYSRQITPDGKYCFTIRESSGRTLAESKLYPDYFSRENAISAVKGLGPFAVIEDLTDVFTPGTLNNPDLTQLLTINN